MLLKNKHVKHSNLKINLPIIGEVQLKDGIVDVPKEVHDLLIGDGMNEWMTGEEIIKESADLDKSDEYEAMIESLSFEEVKSLAEEAKIKNWILFSKNEKALRAYVIKRLHEAKIDADLEQEVQKALLLDTQTNPDDDKETTGTPDEEV